MKERGVIILITRQSVLGSDSLMKNAKSAMGTAKRLMRDCPETVYRPLRDSKKMA